MKKNYYLFTFFIFFWIASLGQSATVIDSKSITLPRYTNLFSITSAIPAPQQGMLVYNTGTATNWYYNGTTWVNMTTIGPIESNGFGSWGCDQSALEEYQPVGNFDGKDTDNFGNAVAISGDYAIVGAVSDNEGIGFNNNGSATIFKRNETNGLWESQVKLVNQAAATNDFFGQSVAISGDYAIVGAYADDEGAGLVDNGTATIYKRNASTGLWESQGKLINPGAANNDRFGISVAISGDYAIVGAYTDDEGVGLTDNGSATIFKRNTNNGVWEPQGKLINPGAANTDYFGWSVAISGDNAIVGAYLDDEGAGLTDNGSATIFVRNNATGVWELQDKITDPNGSNTDYFGRSVSISGEYAIVGAYFDDEGTGLTDNGSAAVFQLNSPSGLWFLQSKLVNQTSGNDDKFGVSVGISGEYAIVGANNDDDGTILSNNGSATIYKRVGTIWIELNKTSNPGAENNAYFGTSVSIDTNLRFVVGENGISNSKGLAIFGKLK